MTRDDHTTMSTLTPPAQRYNYAASTCTGYPYLVSSLGDAIISQNLHSSHKGTSVNQEGTSQMSSQSVLRDSGRGTGRVHQLLIQSRLDHIPSKCTLETNKTTNDQGTAGNVLGEHAAGSKEKTRQNEGSTNGTTEHTMRPFVVKNALEFLECHAMVQTRKFSRSQTGTCRLLRC